MHLTTTNPVSWVWRHNSRADVIPAISFTRLSRRNARISAHAMRMRAFPRMRCECAHFRWCDANARICAHAMRMRAFCACDANARTCAHSPTCDAMRCDANARMWCDANARINGELMRVRYCIRALVLSVFVAKIAEQSYYPTTLLTIDMHVNNGVKWL